MFIENGKMHERKVIIGKEKLGLICFSFLLFNFILPSLFLYSFDYFYANRFCVGFLKF